MLPQNPDFHPFLRCQHRSLLLQGSTMNGGSDSLRRVGQFCTAGDNLELAHGDGRFPRLFRSLVKADLLILDDWGPDRLNAGQRRDLMEIVEDRYGTGSTLITSQLPVDKWHDVIGEPTFADAILDRLVHNAYRLELDGPSMRKLKIKKKEQAA